MNNYIFKNNVYATYGNVTYNYVETNNNYLWSYVFKSSSGQFLYVQNLPTYGSGTGTSGSFSPNGSDSFGPVLVFYNLSTDVKAWSIATVLEAQAIANDDSLQNANQLCVTKSEAYEVGCKIKNAESYNRDWQCVKYADLEKAKIYTYNIEFSPVTYKQESTEYNQYYINLYEGNGYWDGDEPQYPDAINGTLEFNFDFTGVGYVNHAAYSPIYEINELKYKYIIDAYDNESYEEEIYYYDAARQASTSQTCSFTGLDIKMKCLQPSSTTIISNQFWFEPYYRYSQQYTVRNATTQHNTVRVNITLNTI